MCKSSTFLKFCTCITDDDIIEEKSVCKWTLCRLVDVEKETKIMGKILKPSDNLENGVTIEEVLSLLNKGNIFDFEYSPVENDTLRVSSYSKEEQREYFSLIYKNSQWTKGNNPAFRSRKEIIAIGHIKTER